MANLISALISAFGALTGAAFLALAVLEYRDGASVLWVGLGSMIFLSTAFTLVRDVRALARGRRPEPASGPRPGT
ncbi:hypothetical protein C0036_27355 [Streptomyces sp. DJ]|nr:hypothetical protein C0036_27355 [Streptomyces sp. DJ]